MPPAQAEAPPAANRPMPPVATVPMTAVMPPSTAPIAPPTATAVPRVQAGGIFVMIFTEMCRLPILGANDGDLIFRESQVQQAVYGLIGIANRRIHADTDRLIKLRLSFHGNLSVLAVTLVSTGQLAILRRRSARTRFAIRVPEFRLGHTFGLMAYGRRLLECLGYA